MAQQVTTLAARPDEPSSIPETTVNGENWLLSSDLYICASPTKKLNRVIKKMCVRVCVCVCLSLMPICKFMLIFLPQGISVRCPLTKCTPWKRLLNIKRLEKDWKTMLSKKAECKVAWPEGLHGSAPAPGQRLWKSGSIMPWCILEIQPSPPRSLCLHAHSKSMKRFTQPREAGHPCKDFWGQCSLNFFFVSPHSKH